MKQQIDIKEIIKKHNEKNKKSTGCIVGFLNIILAFIVIICVLGLLITWSLSGFDKMLDNLGLVVTFLIFAILLNWGIKKILLGKSSRLNKSIIENAKVKIVEGRIVGHRIEENQTTNIERETTGLNKQYYREYYTQIDISGSVKELDLGLGVYSKFKKDDEVFLIEVNGYYYDDMVFNKNEYELNEQSLKALNNEIIV